MNTLFFCNIVPDKVGAYEAFLAELSRRFRAEGDALLIVLGGEPSPPIAARLRADGLTWEVLPGWTDAAGREHAWAFCCGALRLLRARRPELAIVNYGNELPTLTTALLAPFVGAGRTRWAWQQHQQVRDPSRVTRHCSLLRLLALRMRGFLAVYEGGRESLRKRGIPDARIAVVYNGIRDHTPTRPAGWLRPSLGLDAAVKLLVTTGWLIPRKRIDFLLRALARLQSRLPRPAVLLVMGDGPERAALEALAETLGVSSVVRFLGLRNDVRDLLAEADLLVHASTAETCTYAITEAMAAARPAVVTEAGAAHEQILDGETGAVLARDDLDGFVAALLHLLGDDTERARRGAAARRRWEQRYRLEASALHYHALCRVWAGRTDTDPSLPMNHVPLVCHLVLALEPGGLEQLVVTWTNARNRRYPGSTWIVCLDAAGALASGVTGDVVRVLAARRDRAPWDADAVGQLRRLLRVELAGRPVAVIHSHNTAAQQYAALATWCIGTRHVHTAHGSNVHVSGFKHRMRHRVLALLTNRLVAVSADTAARMAPLWGVRRSRMAVIANGVEEAPVMTDDALQAMRRALGISPGARVLGGVGRLATVKGYDQLLAALPAAAAAVPAVTLVLVGDGPERAALEAQAEALGVRERVLFVGYRPDARRLLPLFDLYVAPSRSEGLPIALLEAMAAGCPVLVTDVGEQRAVIADGAAGTLLPASSEDWASTLISCLGPEGRAQAAAKAEVAARRVAEHYSLAASLAAYEHVYKSVSRGRRGA